MCPQKKDFSALLLSPNFRKWKATNKTFILEIGSKFPAGAGSIEMFHDVGLQSLHWHAISVVKLCVHFVSVCLCVKKVSILCLVSVCLKVQKWTQTDTKVTFHPPPPPPPPPATRKLFLVLNERYDQNKTFLLWCYGIDFAPIKRYHPFCFLWLYIRRQRLSLYDLSVCC